MNVVVAVVVPVDDPVVVAVCDSVVVAVEVSVVVPAVVVPEDVSVVVLVDVGVVVTVVVFSSLSSAVAARAVVEVALLSSSSSLQREHDPARVRFILGLCWPKLSIEPRSLSPRSQWSRRCISWDRRGPRSRHPRCSTPRFVQHLAARNLALGRGIGRRHTFTVARPA